MERRITRIALAGEGGQGVQSIAQIMAEAAYEEGNQAIYIPNFGVEQRGGVSIAFLQTSKERIGAPKFDKGDVVVALSERAVSRTAGYCGPNTIFVYDSSLDVKPEDLPKQAGKILAIPAVDISNKELHPRVFNIIIMGVIIGLAEVVSFEDAKAALNHKLGAKFEKNPNLRELNYRALEIGRDLALKYIREGAN
ncbi:MAG: 2-oxoacid:acceptor oxidoreductase family protein [Methylocystaceae bacterium]